MELTYTPLEKIKIKRPVNRITWIVEQVRGKTVLDLGAYDETALVKQGTGFYLHARMAGVAREVVGIDHSANLPAEGLRTSDNSTILRGDFENLGGVIGSRRFDVIVGGEFLEHLPEALKFLALIKKKEGFSQGLLILTTPNATALHNVILGLLSRESQHADHLQLYSYKTLNTLCSRAGFQAWEILPYHAQFTEMVLRSKGIFKLFVQVSEKIVQVLETLFPFLSGGWIVKIKI